MIPKSGYRVLGLAYRRPDIAEATLIRANIGFRRRRQMASRQRDQLVAIRITQRGDHADVVAARPIERVRVGIGIRPDAVDLLPELFDGLDETGIAAQLIQGPVKMKVAVKYRQQITAVDRRTVLALNVLELVDVAAGDGERQNSNGH